MSYLNNCLNILGFSYLEEVTASKLKSAFKVKVLQAHPDKGGSQELFDKLLSAYVFLINIEKRIYGGRNCIIGDITPEELKENRIDEIVDRIFEEFELEKFNTAFESQHKKVVNGYGEWLKNKDDDTNVINGKYGDATQTAPTFDTKDLNSIFVSKAKEGKPEPSAIILHPEAMAYVSGNTIGTAIIEQTAGPYTSDPYENPEFCDVYTAYTSENTICDKVSENITIKTLEELIQEREMDITPFDNKELEAINEFEKLKLENNKNHIAKVKEYFESNENTGLNYINSGVNTDFVVEFN
jgi:hypothetical protein